MPIIAIIVFVLFVIAAIGILIVWCALLISCIKKSRKDLPPCYSRVTNAPIVVTSATHTAPGGYPVSQMPVGATTTATGYQTQAYPAPQAYAAPYPPQGVPTQMPMPMPASQPPVPGLQPYVAPYPPMANDAPPSYDMAVSGAGAGVPNNGTYEKQAPYNPNFSG
ncbi:uncharacterized protein isoform X2 [Musca autumnalis]|uniref:uncharacterized protein isoform X2 n=1 Tax=Musca autumnalis TaxID=221902 RepID=UPI003CF55CBB